MLTFRFLYFQLLMLGWVLMASAQSKTWYFGKHAGVDFSTANPTPISGPIYTTEGCAVVSNPKGEVQLSTDGISLFDTKGIAQHNGLWGSPSSTHSAIIVPHPANPCTRFLVFTVPSASVSSYSNGMHVLDVKVENGNLEVKHSRKLLDHSTEKLAATEDGNGGYWVVGHDYVDTASSGRPEGRRFYTWHITSNTSIQNLQAITSTTNTAHQGRSPWSPGNYHNTVGQMKFNQTGDMLAVTIYWDQVVELLRFDKRSGKIYDMVKLDGFIAEYPERSLYGIEFSPSGHFLYTSSAYVSSDYEGLILGFDIRHLNQQLIWDSRQVIATALATDSNHYPFGAMQTGPDGKIYVAKPYTQRMASINGNAWGAANQFQDTAVVLNDTCLLGLPTQIKVPDCSFGSDKCQYLSLDIGEDTAICQQDSVIIGVEPREGLSYHWNTGEKTPSIVARANHIYKLTITDTNGCKVSDFREIKSLLAMADLNLTTDTTVCHDVNSRVALNVQNIAYEWLDGSPGVFHEAQQSGPVPVRLFGPCDTLDHIINLTVEDCRCKVFVPNAFTPDGDELNDIHRLQTSCTLQDFKFTVFNRWGEVVFQTTDINQSWRGTFQNQKVKGEVYVYKLAYKAENNDWQYDQGTITVLR